MQLSLLTVVTMILVLVSASADSTSLRGLQARKLCDMDGSQCCDWGDCKHQPTICGRQSGNVVGMRPGNVVSGRRYGNVIDCHYIAPRHDEERTNTCEDMCRATFFEKNNDSEGGVPGPNRYTCNEEEMNNHPNWCAYKSCKWKCPDDIVTPSLLPAQYSDEARTCYDKGCSEEVFEDYPDWCMSEYLGRFGGYIGWCHGTNGCLNLNFYCAEGEYCQMDCDGGSCEGLKLHCADNQVCLLKYGGNAEVICGEGTVARSAGPDFHGCVLADTADDCGSAIEVCDPRSGACEPADPTIGGESPTSSSSSTQDTAEAAIAAFASESKDPAPSGKCADSSGKKAFTESRREIFKGKTCDWIMQIERNIVNKCTMSSKLGMVYDVCPLTCAKLGFGPCATKNEKGGKPRNNNVIDDFWNNSRELCRSCGGFWPITQPANCLDKNGKDLKGC